MNQESGQLASRGGRVLQWHQAWRAVVFLGVLSSGFFLQASGSVPTAPTEAAPDDRELSEVMQLLKSRYADPAAVTDNKIGNASLSAVLNRLGGGAMLMTQPALANPAPRPIVAELLPGKIAYWRVPTFKPNRDWAQLENQLYDWQKNGAIGMVLDLRDFETANDYAGAARMASIFTAPGETLFTVQGLQIPQQIYRSTNTSSRRQVEMPLVVLTNRRSMGAAEALAAVLRQQAHAILVGRSTAGQAAYFTETKLSSGRYLRLATGQASLADGTQLFGKPIVPDIALYIDDQSERLALEGSSQDGTAMSSVQELTPRARTSEAALVHGENPELDEVLSQQLLSKDEGTKTATLQDVALIRAMDVLRSIQFAMNQSQSRDVLTSKK
ncbi:MAG: hypothetical protein B9S32_07825 [Verrucomicrobia bacterium Tous-C9LFEB]|nr:MAG: hypothetical protein B9S32_07825 [Verrucomicrobia bacterium Tous-C9LFEB]